MQLQACLPHGDLDLGYQMHSSVFGHGAYLMLRHEQESIAAANAPVSSVYSGTAHGLKPSSWTCVNLEKRYGPGCMHVTWLPRP